jgi:hypothetical protein
LLDPAVIAIAGAGIDGVTASAAALELDVSPSTATLGSTTATRLLAIDPAAYAGVVADTPADVGLPPSFAAEPGAGVGTEAAPIPAVVSTRLSNGWEPRAIGEPFALQVRGQPMWFVIEEIRDTVPGLPANATFVLAPLAAVTAGHDRSPLRPSTIFLRAPAEVGPALTTALAATERSGTLTSRHAQFAAVHDAPLVGAVGRGFLVALAVAAAYAALAVVAVIALDAQRRARESAFLRTLGLTDRQLVGLTVVEHAPPVSLALLIGIGLGLGVAWLLAPGLELAVFIDPGAPVVLQVDWGTVVAVVIAIVFVVAVAIGASSWFGRRLDASQALRVGEA